MKKSDYPFDLEQIDKLNCHWNWIVSKRGPGKTYQVLLKAFEDYIRSSEKTQLAIIRRWESDFISDTGMKTCYDSLICNGYGENMIKKISKGKYDSVAYRAGKYYLIGKGRGYPEKVIAYSFALSQSERYKGGSFPNIERVLVDEACSESNDYLKREFSHLQSIISTIIRNRENLRVYLCANTVDFYCPLFDDFCITDGLKTIKKGETLIWTFGEGTRVSFTWLDVDAKANKRKSDVFFGFDNSTSKMITQGEWMTLDYPHLPVECEYKSYDVMYTYFIEYKGQLFQCDIVNNDDSMFAHYYPKTTPIRDDTALIFTDEYTNDSRRVYGYKAANKASEKVIRFNRIYPQYYSSNMVGAAVNSFVKSIQFK